MNSCKQLERKTKQVQMLNDRYQQLMQRVSAAEKQRMRTAEEIKHTSTKLQDVSLNAVKAEQEAITRQKAIDALSKDNAGLAQELAKQSEEKERVISQLRAYIKEIEELLQANEALLAEATQLRAENTRLMQVADDERSRAEVMQQEKEQLRNVTDETITELTLQLKSLHDTVASLTTERDSLKTQAEKSATQLVGHKCLLTLIPDNLQSQLLKERETDATRKIDTLQKVVQTAQQECESLRRDRDALKQTMSQDIVCVQ